MPLDPRLISSRPAETLEDSQLKFLQETNIDYADSFKKPSTEPPFTINRFDEQDLRRKIQAKKPKLNPRLSFKVRTTDMDFFFKLKIRFCADGSKMILGIHYDESYSPSCSSFSFVSP